jgi:hypothetical protein
MNETFDTIDRSEKKETIEIDVWEIKHSELGVIIALFCPLINAIFLKEIPHHLWQSDT